MPFEVIEIDNDHSSPQATAAVAGDAAIAAV